MARDTVRVDRIMYGAMFQTILAAVGMLAVGVLVWRLLKMQEGRSK